MSRVTPCNREDLPEFEEIFIGLEKAIGFIPGGLLVMGRNPSMLGAWLPLVRAVYHEENTVSSALKRLVAHTISRAAGCPYSMAHTAHAAADHGVPVEKITAVFDCADDPQFTEAERAALSVARAAGAVPNGVDDDLFAVLSAHFSDDQVFEIIAVISLFGFLNRWQATLALKLEDEPREFAEIHLANIGWTIGRHA